MVTFKRPLPGAPISSGFGMRGGKLHAGIDIAAAPGTPIGAAAAGIVTRAGWFGGYGNCVDIDHGGGWSTRYGHMLKVSVRISQPVDQGDTVGLEGSTGDSTGPHCHFEIRKNGNAVDPIPYLKGSVAATNDGGFTAENISVIPGKDALNQIEKLSKALVNPRFWESMGWIALGGLLVIFAVLAMGGSSATKGIVKAVGKAVKSK